MSDDKEHRRPDETGEFFPFRDEGDFPPNDGPRKDETDRTQVFPGPDEDATRVTPRPPQSDATSVLPAASAPGTPTERHTRTTANWADDGDPVWSGRAGVRAPRPGSGDEYTPADWATEPADEPRGKWWTPIAVGIVALLLLGLLGWGLYLIAQADGGDDGSSPAVTASPAAPVTTTDPVSEPPSVAPTTTEPSTSPTPSPTDINVPALKGLSSAEARAALDRKGLNYRLRFVSSDSPAGTVIDSDPSEGQQVPADTVVTLIIAAAPTAPATPVQTSPTDTGGQPEGE